MEKLIVGKSLEHQLDKVIKELAPAGNISYAVLLWLVQVSQADSVHSLDVP
ncbi:hypothetical protein [Veillonella dispar]|uniref:hypothetical protein n=1 Tax=Veillonella dispar TaxID=39778 RepID=UPI0026EE67ED|nr:hypothetical protein [Veillonella dispar]